MKAAYLYQSINFIVALVTMFLLLHHLSVDQYVLWSIFVTIVGITVQLENSVQTVSVREIALEYHGYSFQAFKQSIAKAKRAYLILAIFVATIISLSGVLYISYIGRISSPAEYLKEWILLILAYTINYFFGKNNSILLATNKISFFNYTIAFTRVLNLLFIYFFLNLGYSIFGMALGLFFSVVIGCFIIGGKAHRVLRDIDTSRYNLESKINETTRNANKIFFSFTIYTLFAFLIYKGGILLVAAQFDKTLVASYALSIQIFTLLSTFSFVPIQIWLHALVRAVNKNDTEMILHELAKTILIINVLFIFSAGGLILLGGYILTFVETDIKLPGSGILVFMSVAFLIELNILLFINYLVTSRCYEFVKLYIKSSITSLFLAVVSVHLTKNLVLSLLVIPSVVQLLFGLPRIFKVVSNQLNLSRKQVANKLWCNFKEIVLT